MLLARRRLALPEERQSQLKQLIALGKEQSHLTYEQINDHLPPEIVDREDIEEIVDAINDLGIPVLERAPEASTSASETFTPEDLEAIRIAGRELFELRLKTEPSYFDKVSKSLMGLTQHEEKVVRLLYGLDGSDGLTLSEVAHSLGISAQNVQALEQSAFRKLQK